jgi:hypothetical protein
VEEDMRARALREWHMIEFFKKEVRLIVNISDVIVLSSSFFEEEEDVVEEMGE